MSPRIIIGIAGLAFALLLFGWRPWVTATPTPIPETAKSYMNAEKTKPGTSLLSAVGQEVMGSTVGPVQPSQEVRVRIIGGAGDDKKWVYLLSTGELLTASQIAGRYSIRVSEVLEDGVTRIQGEGIVYGSGRD